jgi:hypothetical protein
MSLIQSTHAPQSTSSTPQGWDTPHSFRTSGLVTGLLLLRPEFVPGSIHVWFVVNKMTLGQVSHWVLQFSLSIYHSIIDPYSSVTTHEVCDSTDQAAHYHTLSPKLGLHIWPSTWLEQRKEIVVCLTFVIFSCHRIHLLSCVEVTVQAEIVESVHALSSDNDSLSLKVKIFVNMNKYFPSTQNYDACLTCNFWNSC